MRGVAFYRLDQIRDEISAAFELDVDVGPRVLGADSKRDKAVVNEDEEQCENDDDDQEADQHSWRGLEVGRRCTSRGTWSTTSEPSLAG